MREIKFRFWGPFGEWEEPDEMTQKMTMFYGDEFAWEEYEPINDLFASLGNSEPATIAMQFTGLHDKNGKEIYEGDILKHATLSNDPGFVVEWETIDVTDDYAGFYAGYGFNSNTNEYEVIGNIYDNPEILKDKT